MEKNFRKELIRMDNEAKCLEPLIKRKEEILKELEEVKKAKDFDVAISLIACLDKVCFAIETVKDKYQEQRNVKKIRTRGFGWGNKKKGIKSE